MGTRNLTCVYYKGEYKVAQYGQWDGYPSGQGATCLKFLREQMNEELFKQKLDQLSYYTTQEIRGIYVAYGSSDGMISVDNYHKMGKRFPALDRDTGAEILSIIQQDSEPTKLENSIEFASDSLFCEWAYVIDFDKRTFEVFRGFNKTPLEVTDRFYWADQLVKEGEYRAIKLKKSYDLDELPTIEEFIDDNEEEEDNEKFV